MVGWRGHSRDTNHFVAADVVAQVRACGMDPMTATAEEMRAKNAHFAVRIREGDRTILNWNAMVSARRGRWCFGVTTRSNASM